MFYRNFMKTCVVSLLTFAAEPIEFLNMEEKEFIISLLSETKELYRTLMREKFKEGTKKREELEKRFRWEDRFIPDK